jgi:hypothetical protein
MRDKAAETIPEQREGVEVNVEETVACADESEAQKLFLLVKEKLLNVNRWHNWAGTLSASFQLTDSQGTDVQREPEKGDFFKIDIPAPGIQTGEGYDWVQIEEIVSTSSEADEYVSVRVRPASSPVNEKRDIAHFYTDAATSNFIVRRDGTKVTAGVYGRNEKPNVEEADGILDKVRNAIVGTGGVTGFSKLQWSALVSGLLDTAKK